MDTFTRKQIPLKTVVLALAIAINALVGINNLIHDPNIGYDSDAHLDYAATLFNHFPTKADTYEFFSPPLPYLIPAIGYKTCEIYTKGSGNCSFIAGRLAQLINFFLSIGITILFIKIAEAIKPNNEYFKISALVIWGMLPVYYKTFSQVRGETYVAFFVILALYIFIQMRQSPQTISWKKTIGLGAVLGLLVLSRQWGFALFPAFFCAVILVYLRDKTLGYKLGKVILASFFVAFLVSGWFYIYLFKTYGSFAAFNSDTLPFSFSNHPSSFYKNIGIRDFILFKSPTRNTFNDQVIPLFYSEIWGDYWGYFVFIRSKSAYGAYENINSITPYLGRVNLVSLIPSLLLLGGVGAGAKNLWDSLRNGKRDSETLFYGLFFLIFFFSSAAYFWFLVTHVVEKGATIKATYMLQVFIVLPFLVSEMLEKIRSMNLKTYWAIIGTLGFVFLHNLPAMVSRYWWVEFYSIIGSGA